MAVSTVEEPEQIVGLLIETVGAVELTVTVALAFVGPHPDVV